MLVDIFACGRINFFMRGKTWKKNTYITKRGEEFYLFDKGKYERLRKGEIVPIPMSKTEGFALWSGYAHTRNLRLKTLKDCKIRRK